MIPIFVVGLAASIKLEIVGIVYWHAEFSQDVVLEIPLFDVVAGGRL